MDPVLNAVSSSARQLHLLLRCVNFSSKAYLRISPDGLRVTVEEGRVMQGIAFLDKSLFSSFIFASDDDPPPFEFSLAALLESLQMLGTSSDSSKERWPDRTANRNAFEARNVLGVASTCRLIYQSIGAPLTVILEEKGVTTTCKLNTYEPDDHEDIPLQKDAIVQKIIMRASWLHDAITELSSTSPTRIIVSASPHAPHFAVSSSGPLGSATVEFSKDPQLLETFQVPAATSNTYKYNQIQAAVRAMARASKVSIRTDAQGVLSLQFMVEVEQAAGGAAVSFLDFRFVPFLDSDSDED